MKRTKSMYFNPTAESRELALFAVNDYLTYSRSIEPTVANLRKHFSRGRYDDDKAIDAFYHVADYANKRYYSEFGHKFTVTERYNAAVTILMNMREDITIA